MDLLKLALIVVPTLIPLDYSEGIGDIILGCDVSKTG